VPPTITCSVEKSSGTFPLTAGWTSKMLYVLNRFLSCSLFSSIIWMTLRGAIPPAHPAPSTTFRAPHGDSTRRLEADTYSARTEKCVFSLPGLREKNDVILFSQPWFGSSSRSLFSTRHPGRTLFPCRVRELSCDWSI